MHATTDLLNHAPLFEGLDPAAVAAVKQAARVRSVDRGGSFFHRGDPAEALHVLVSVGIWAMGLLVYTTFVRVTVPVLTGKLSAADDHATPTRGELAPATAPPPFPTGPRRQPVSDRFIWTRIASAAAAAVALAGTLGLMGTTPPAAGQAFGLPELSPESRACADCHKKDNIGLYQQWGASKHCRGSVGCYECHAARPGEPYAKLHYDHAVMERLLADGRFCRFPTRRLRRSICRSCPRARALG